MKSYTRRRLISEMIKRSDKKNLKLKTIIQKINGLPCTKHQLAIS